jgi:hypothetical protein
LLAIAGAAMHSVARIRGMMQWHLCCDAIAIQELQFNLRCASCGVNAGRGCDDEVQ